MYRQLESARPTQNQPARALGECFAACFSEHALSSSHVPALQTKLQCGYGLRRKPGSYALRCRHWRQIPRRSQAKNPLAASEDAWREAGCPATS